MSIPADILDFRSQSGGEIRVIPSFPDNTLFIAVVVADKSGCIGSTSYKEGELIIATNAVGGHDYLDKAELRHEQCGVRNDGEFINAGLL